MRILLVTLLLTAAIVSVDGEKDGRRGNELYEQEDYDLAVEAYRSGLSALADDTPSSIRYGLENNLGAALLKSGDPTAAAEAFSRALSSAPGRTDIARTAYNAGNAAFSSEELEAALAYYRQSLLNDPSNRDAKFNYEFVKRRLQQQQQQQEGDGDESDEEQENEDGRGDQNQEPQQEGDQQEEGGESEQQGQQPEQQESERPEAEASEPTDRLSEEQAQRILQALQNEEEQLLRQIQRQPASPQRVEKDW